MRLFKKKTNKEIKLIKENLSSFEKSMFDRLTDLELNLNQIREEDKKKYDSKFNKEEKQIENIENLTKEILKSVEMLEKNQMLLSEEVSRLKLKIRD